MAYPNALNFTEMALLQLGPEPTRAQKIAMSMINYGTVMTDIKVKTENRLTAEGARQIALANTGGWGKLNSDPQFTKNLPEPWKEQKYRYFKAWDIEKVILDQQGARAEKEAFSKLIDPDLMEFSFDFNYRFFNNRHTGTAGTERNTDCYVGVRARLATAGAGGPYRIPAECRRNANALDLSPTAMATESTFKQNVNILFKYIADMLETMGRPQGDGVTIYLNQDLHSLLEMGLRLFGAGGGFRMDKDAFDREVMKFRNANVRLSGRTAPDANGAQAQIVTSTESADGLSSTGSVYTSIFFVLSEEGKFHIEQFYETEPTDPQTLDDQVTRRSVLYNFYGLVQEHNRALGQIYGIKVA